MVEASMMVQQRDNDNCKAVIAIIEQVLLERGMKKNREP